MQRSLYRKRSHAGFTLAEVMAVVAIVGVLAVAALFAAARTLAAPSASALARNVQYAFMRARAETTGDGAQRRLSCSAAVCTYQMATSTGMGPPAGWIDVDSLPAGTHATIWNVTHTTDRAADNSGVPMTGTQTITFYPDGSATPATVYVADRSSSSAPTNRYKIYVYAGTSMARQVANW